MSEENLERNQNILEIITEERLDIKFFYALHAKGNRDVVEWCMKKNLISSGYKCPTCGKDMKLIDKIGPCDGFVWYCRSYGKEEHLRNISVRKYSIFENIKISLSMSLLMSVMWMNNCSHSFIRNELRLCVSTVRDWLRLCREVCIDLCVRDSERIGGKDIVVEIDVSEFMINKGKKGKGVQGKYAICGINCVTNKFFVRIVEDRTAVVLLKVLEEFVLPGSVIISECWKSSECFSHIKFKEYSKKNKVTFRDPPIIHGKAVDGIWKKIEFTLSKTRHVMNLFDDYKAEYLWQLGNEQRTIRQKMESFFDIAKVLYPIP